MSSPACAACHHSQFSGYLHSSSTNFNLISCNHCGLIRTFPFPTGQKLYNTTVSAYRNPRTGQRFGKFLNFLINSWRNVRVRKMYLLANNGPVLDVGCGQAIELQSLKKLGLKVTGTEFSVSYAKSLSALTQIPILSGNLNRENLPPHSFGLITFFHSLEHFTDPITAVKTAQKLLLPHGHLIISVPDISSPEALFFGPHWFHLDIPHHLYHFSRKWLINYLKQNGFSIKSTTAFAPEYDLFSLWQSQLNAIFPHHPNLLYKFFLREQTLSSKEKISLLLQLPIILITWLLSVPSAIFLWLTNSAGTIEIIASKN